MDSDPAMPTTRIGIDEVRGAVPLPVTDGVSKQARLNIGEVVWPVVMPIIAMGAAIVRQYGARSKGEEKTKHRYKSWHVALAFWSFIIAIRVSCPVDTSGSMTAATPANRACILGPASPGR